MSSTSATALSRRSRRRLTGSDDSTASDASDLVGQVGGDVEVLLSQQHPGSFLLQVAEDAIRRPYGSSRGIIAAISVLRKLMAHQKFYI